MLSLERCKPLQGHKVVLFPDLGAFDDWKKVADKLHFGVSDLLERYATEEERKSGFDLADYLVRFDISQFEKQESPIAPRREYAQTQISTDCKVAPKDEMWDMASLESCFSTLQLPKEIRLNDYTTIFDTKQFVGHHLEILKTNDGNPTYKPYKDRLIELIYQINKN